jgi:NAD(P)-dependent dehydrogenase (short-subunit alcohol dehydrogenase family)
MARAEVMNALVTGGARRIGRAIVEDLARHGFGVAIHCNRSRADAEALAGEIAGRGGRAAVIDADLADPVALETVVERAEQALGPLSILVNNASMFESDTAADFDWQVWDRHFAVHVKAPAALTRAFAATCAGARDGLVVNIVDQRVWRPTPRFFSYSLSKSALWTATRTMAQTFAPNVRVNGIGPGPTLASARQDPTAFAAQVEGVLLDRGPALEEFGATIRYLWQARSVTGQMIALDGGQHLAWQTPDVAGIAE